MKSNVKKFLITLIIICMIPILAVVAKVIYAYGTEVGTYARTILEA
ncbi:MAG TPA: hypothetical protein PLV83_04540 [Bacilli bacterium]|nr:hypothetical protein [Bacilli bacterium]